MSIDIESYYRRYAPMVLRRCRFLMRDEEQAMDMTQETFVRLVQNQETLTHSAPSSLLYTIATNLCLNALKSRQNRSKYLGKSGDEDVPFNDPSQKISDAKALLDEIFAQDDEKTRSIAYFHYVDLFTLEETAQRVGMSVSGVRKRLRKLKALAAPYEEVWR